MKTKNYLIVLVALLFIGCKDRISVQTKEALPLNDEIIYKMAKWLKDNDKKICPIMSSDTIIQFHTIQNDTYNQYLKDFFGNSNVNHKKIKWSDFKDYIEGDCYDKYIAFNCDYNSVNDNNEITIKTINDFTLKQACYSKALFKSLEKKYSVVDTTTFYFSKARVNGNKVVIFKIKDSKSKSMVFQDLSQNPTSIIEIFRNFYNIQNQK